MVGVGCQYPGRETWLGLGASAQVRRRGGVGCQYPGRETWWGLGVSAQVGRRVRGWVSLPR